MTVMVNRVSPRAIMRTVNAGRNRVAQVFGVR